MGNFQQQSMADQPKCYRRIDLSSGTNPIARQTATKFCRNVYFLPARQPHRIAIPAARKSDSIPQIILRKKATMTKVFPAVLLVCNIGAAASYAMAGDWKRALYWFASSACVAAVTY
jgi:hypothetical protein